MSACLPPIGAPNVEVRRSSIAGLGIFALASFGVGEPIRKVEFVREVSEQSPLRPERGERAEHCSYADGKLLLVAFPDRHMNHSCDPNAYYCYQDGQPLTRARRRIVSGEEISVDYLINNSGGESWPCKCGAPRCRGKTGVSFFTLPLAVQREYLPLLAPWFRQMHADRLESSRP